VWNGRYPVLPDAESSAAAPVAARDDVLVSVRPLLELVPEWSTFIGAGEDDGFAELVRRHASTGGRWVPTPWWTRLSGSAPGR
jgi:hypothetical protein